MALAVLSFSLLFLLASVWCQIDFFNTGDICDKVTCEELDPSDCTGGVIKKVESSCGCDICVKYVGEGEKCAGTNVRVQCKAGLRCNEEEGKCVGKTKCESDRSHKESLMKKGVVSKNSWLPLCTQDGGYAKVQFTESKAICVDENGKRLFGQEQKAFAGNMTCECSHYLSKKKEREKTTWANGPIGRCDSRGDYDALQCVGDVCYCADRLTGKVKGMVTHIKQWKLLPCYAAAKHGEKYESNCEKEMFRINLLTHQFSMKGIATSGLTLAECEPDGTFAPKQCLPNTCYCVEERGFSFDAFKAEKDRSRGMNCRCARDNYLIQTYHLQYPDLRCSANGNYYPLQHVDNERFCCDEEGGMIAVYDKTLPQDKMEERCNNAIQSLKRI